MKKTTIVIIGVVLVIFIYHDLIQDLLTILIRASVRIVMIVGILAAVILGIRFFKKSRGTTSYDKEDNNTSVEALETTEDKKDNMDVF